MQNLRDDVFKHFTDKSVKPASAPSPIADAAAGKKRSRSTTALVSSTSAAPVRPVTAIDPSWRATPIIVVPASASSLLNIYNVASFLQVSFRLCPNPSVPQFL